MKIMKKLLLLTLGLMFFWASTTSASFFGKEKSPWEPNLPFDSATIEYKISGMQSGKRTTYVKEHGRYKADYTRLVMNVMGMSQVTETIEITTPDWVYEIDLQSRSGTKNINPVKFMNEEFEKLSKSDQKKLISNLEKMGKAAMLGANAKVHKKAAKLLGYTCDVTELPGSKVYVISGTDFMLKMESNMMGLKHVEEAVSIKKGPVPEDKFLPPKGIQITRDQMADQMARQFATQMVQSFLHGKPLPQGSGMVAPAHGGSQQGSTPPPSTAPQGGQQPDLNQLMQQLQGMMGGAGQQQ